MAADSALAPRVLPYASWQRLLLALLVDDSVLAGAAVGGSRWHAGIGVLVTVVLVLLWPVAAAAAATPGQWVAGFRIRDRFGRRVGVGQCVRRMLEGLVPILFFMDDDEEDKDEASAPTDARAVVVRAVPAF
jgi:uncharacterized RDD family membrane protein YckC